MTSMLIVAGVGLVLVLGAWGLWALSRSWDRTNAIVAAAAPLPIRMVNVWDPVWIRGEIECENPVHLPHFGYPALHFDYKLEKYVTKTRQKGDGKTETYSEWETVETKSDFCSFAVCQEDGRLDVDAAQARWEYEPTQSETLGIWRHSANYTPFPGAISVVGVVGEKKRTLEKLGHVPLIVTPKERDTYLKAAESAERWAAGFGYFLLLLGFGIFGFGLLRYLQTKDHLEGQHWWNTGTALVGLGCGLGAMIVFWIIRTYNNLVIFRTRADQTWSGIDVHLKQRYDLIPNLVEIVKGYAEHEKGLLEHLTKLRGEALTDRGARVVAEKEVVESMTRIALVSESYPDLKANAQYRLLAKQLTALEDKIAHARGFFNDSVSEYNRHLGLFPASLVAGMFGFRNYPLFAAELKERPVPQFKL